MNKFAIFLDIDGTLFDGKKVPESNVRAIAEAQKAGHLVFINSGRSLAFLPKNELSAINFDGYVLGVGSHIIYRGKTYKNVTVSKDILKEVFGMFENTEISCVYEGENMNFMQNVSPYYRNISKIMNITEFDGTYGAARITKITFNPVPCAADLEKLSHIFNVFNHGSYAEICMKGCDKAVGMRQAAEYAGVTVENCIAIGDSLNDREMLLAAGISVAMGNATDEIKKICDYVSADASSGGVAQAIYKFVLNR